MYIEILNEDIKKRIRMNRMDSANKINDLLVQRLKYENSGLLVSHSINFMPISPGTDKNSPSIPIIAKFYISPLETITNIDSLNDFMKSYSKTIRLKEFFKDWDNIGGYTYNFNIDKEQKIMTLGTEWYTIHSNPKSAIFSFYFYPSKEIATAIQYNRIIPLGNDDNIVSIEDLVRYHKEFRKETFKDKLRQLYHIITK